MVKGITALLKSTLKLIRNNLLQMCTRLGAERRASIYLVLVVSWFSDSSYCNYCLKCQDHKMFEWGTHFKLRKLSVHSFVWWVNNKKSYFKDLWGGIPASDILLAICRRIALFLPFVFLKKEHFAFILYFEKWTFFCV